MNGTPTDITETFRITSNDKSDTVIESERNASAFNSRIAAQASYKNGGISQFEIEWQNDNEGAVKFASAHYQFTEDKILVNRNIDEQAFLETLPMPEVFIVLPLLRVFTGKAIREAFELGQGQRVPVLVPNIKDPNDNIQLLALELDMRSASHIGQETITLNETEHTVDIFHFTGGNYDQTAKFWVDENDILLKYEWQQDPDLFWEVKLIKLNNGQ
jgi:hypothetical protein